MKISVAGHDVSATLGAALDLRAAQIPAPQSVICGPEDSALNLRKARNPADYLAILCRLLRVRHGLYTGMGALALRPRRHGLLGRLFQPLIIKLLAYEHGWIAHQQGMINELIVNALDMERAAFETSRVRMEKRITELEEKVATLQHRHAQEGRGA
jgi:hypothetical protein